MYPASLIAFAFVKKGIEEGNYLTQMKLQKMVYFAHGIHLAQYHKPLIIDPIQAWQYGPVVPRIYQEYKFYGSSPITDTNMLITKHTEAELAAIDVKARRTIDQTWSVLKNWSAVQLSNWTHAEGSPWSKYYVPSVSDVRIPDPEMEEYFQRYLIKDAAVNQ